MKKIDLIQDLSTLTTIPKQTLLKIEKRKETCIAHSVLESIFDGNDTTLFDIGIGSLYIQHKDDEIQYKFIPNLNFEQLLVNTIKTKESPLVTELDESLFNKITQAYKDLF